VNTARPNFGFVVYAIAEFTVPAAGLIMTPAVMSVEYVTNTSIRVVAGMLLTALVAGDKFACRATITRLLRIVAYVVKRVVS